MVFGGIIGVNDPFPMVDITSFNPITNTWSMIGKMNSARGFTSVIERNNEYLIVGAQTYYPDARSEKCPYNQEKLVCHYQEPTMNEKGKTNIRIYKQFSAYYHIFPYTSWYCIKPPVDDTNGTAATVLSFSLMLLYIIVN